MLKLPHTKRIAATAVLLCAMLGVVSLTTGCSADKPADSKGGASAEATPAVGANMAGPSQKVVISKQAVAAKPEKWDLSTPESAVRSYLDWTSYAYRITESSAATRTMSPEQEVRVDSYVQLNLQKSRILDQALASITFGKASIDGTRALLPATEKWTYRYVSIAEVGKTLEGPYDVAYETTYTVVKQKGGWVVDDVSVKALSEVK